MNNFISFAKKSLYFTVAIALIVLTGCNQSPDTVTVQGEGIVRAVPDVVDMTIEIKFIKPKLQEAVQKTRSTVDTLLELCNKYHIDTKDIKTSYISSGKEYQWINNSNKFIGFSSMQMNNITVRDISKFEKFSGELLELGINSIDNIQFTTSRLEQLQAEANILALENASASAKAIADKISRKLGEVKRVQDAGVEVPNDLAFNRFNVMEKRVDNASIVLNPGIIEVKKKVIVMYELN